MSDPSNPTGVPLAAPGKLSADEMVFGVGFKRDIDGNPIEQGHGALGHETPSHKFARDRALRLEGMKDGDREELKKLLREIVQPPEDMTPEQRARQDAKDAAAKVQEDAQEKRIADLEAKLAALIGAKQDTDKNAEF